MLLRPQKITELIEKLLFYAQAEHFQRISLTSQYRPWKEKYRWGHLPHDDCAFIELRDWPRSMRVTSSAKKPASTPCRSTASLGPTC